MATQRINPDTVLTGELQPQASPVDTYVRISTDLDINKEKDLIATAQGLSAFGKGVIDIQAPLQDKAQQQANELYIKNEQLSENQREWQKLSDKGWARFNPYTKKYYNQLMSDELVSTKIAQFKLNNPALQYEDIDIAQQKIQDFKNTTLEELTQKGYRPAEIENALTRASTFAATESTNYYDAHAQVEYTRGLNAFSNTLSNEMINHKYNEVEPEQTLGALINNQAVVARQNGFTREDTARAIEQAFQRTIKYKMMNDPTFAGKSRADYMSTIDNLTIDGVSIKDINPNFKQNMSDFFDQTQAQVSDLENRQYTQYQREQQMKYEQATSEIGKLIQLYPNDPERILRVTNKTITDYGLYGEYQEKLLAFANGVNRQTESLQEGWSDPQLKKRLFVGLYNGSLTKTDVMNYQDQLTSNDLAYLLNVAEGINTEQKQEVNAIVGIKSKQYKNNLQAFAIKNIRDKNEQNAFVREMLSKEEDLQYDVITSSDKIAAGKKYNDSIYELNANFKKYYDNYKEQNYFNKKILNNTTPMQYTNTVGATSGFLFFKPAYKNNVRQTYKIGDKPKSTDKGYYPKTTGAFGEPRQGNKGEYNHQGIDVGTPAGDICVNPFNSGKILAIGYDKGGYGNFVTLDLGNGYTATFGHLSGTVQGAVKGAYVPSGTVLAYTGNTGKSTGAHTDISVRHYGVPVNPYTYLKKIQGK